MISHILDAKGGDLIYGPDRDRDSNRASVGRKRPLRLPVIEDGRRFIAHSFRETPRKHMHEIESRYADPGSSNITRSVPVAPPLPPARAVRRRRADFKAQEAAQSAWSPSPFQQVI